MPSCCWHQALPEIVSAVCKLIFSFLWPKLIYMTMVGNTIRVWCITSCMCGEVLRARQVTSMRTDLVIYFLHIKGTRGVRKKSVLFIPGAKFSEKCSGKFLTFSFDKWWCWSQRATSSRRHAFRQEQETGRNSCHVSFYLYAIVIFSCKNYSD